MLNGAQGYSIRVSHKKLFLALPLMRTHTPFHFIDNAFVNKLQKVKRELLNAIEYTTRIYCHEIPL